MFAQLLVTLTLAWLAAEILCRALIGRTLREALRGVLGTGERDIEARHLDRLLRHRRRELSRARARLELASEATDVSTDLATVETELAELQDRLTELERSRAARHAELP